MKPQDNTVRFYYGLYGTASGAIKAMREDGYSFSDHKMRARIREIEAENPTHKPSKTKTRKTV